MVIGMIPCIGARHMKEESSALFHRILRRSFRGQHPQVCSCKVIRRPILVGSAFQSLHHTLSIRESRQPQRQIFECTNNWNAFQTKLTSPFVKVSSSSRRTSKVVSQSLGGSCNQGQSPFSRTPDYLAPRHGRGPVEGRWREEGHVQREGTKMRFNQTSIQPSTPCPAAWASAADRFTPSKKWANYHAQRKHQQVQNRLATDWRGNFQETRQQQSNNRITTNSYVIDVVTLPKINNLFTPIPHQGTTALALVSMHWFCRYRLSVPSVQSVQPSHLRRLLLPRLFLNPPSHPLAFISSFPVPDSLQEGIFWLKPTREYKAGIGMEVAQGKD
ncbi:unnamed protein product [Protopolystoma xenopodis]|uniref:Uncharacterized protein n=1 Tax=Protopolystoma xenopodis TaxID=117903 RepID=A0A3S5B359_9PLAT|nr:unnamed protein product [Protopolystoma xenopodis]